MKKNIPFCSVFIALMIIQYIPLQCQNIFLTTHPTAYDKDTREVLNTLDGGYLIAGSTNNNNITDADLYIMKTDAQGNFLWGKTYGGTQKDTPKRLRQTNDGGYIISSTSRSFNWINPDMWILKFDANGDTLWTNHFGGPNHEHGNDVKQTADGGYIMAGHSKSYGPDGQRIMLVRINPAGVVGIKVNNAEISFNLYPNPSKDRVIAIQYSKEGASILKICNSLGQCVYSNTIAFENNETKTITLADNPPGIYMVTLQIENQVTTKK